MQILFGKIKNFSYKKFWREELKTFDLDSKNIDINDLPSKCNIQINNKIMSISKWVSPKRTRSYPYARAYDSFDSCGGKVATIIPIIKDEGIDGDMDYLQWDTISLMSLFNVYAVLGFYEDAEQNIRNANKPNKITNQKLKSNFIYKQLEILSAYHQSALHWNLNQLNSENLLNIINKVKTSYKEISQKLKIKLHDSKNIDKFKINITKDREAFMQYSRYKAKNAQNREVLTLHNKESIGIGYKTKIEIENYLGGYYYFTIDDVLDKDNILYLIESKHSKDSILPSNDDIKDGLLKLMIYNNLCEVRDSKTKRNFKIVLRLTSNKLKSNIELPNDNLESFIKSNQLNKKQIEIIYKLNSECKENKFYIWFQKAQI